MEERSYGGACVSVEGQAVFECMEINIYTRDLLRASIRKPKEGLTGSETVQMSMNLSIIIGEPRSCGLRSGNSDCPFCFLCYISSYCPCIWSTKMYPPCVWDGRQTQGLKKPAPTPALSEPYLINDIFNGNGHEPWINCSVPQAVHDFR